METKTPSKVMFLQPPMDRRSILSGVMASLSGVLLAACGSSAAPAAGTSGSASSTGSQASQPAASKPVKFPDTLYITTIHNFQGDAGFNAAVQAFEQKHKVKLELNPGNNNEVIAKIAAGTPPDVFRRDAAAYHQLVAEGGMRDLNPYFKSATEVKISDYFPHLIRGQSFQGKLMALPEDFQPASVLYYNKTLLEKAGVKVPTQDTPWNEFLETSKRLTQGSGDVADQYGYAFPKWTYEQFVYNFGGKTVDNVENPTKCLLDSSQAVDGLQFMVDLQHKWKVMPSPQAFQAGDLKNENAWFSAGKMATLNSGTWVTSNWAKVDGLQWGMTLAPKGQDGKPHYATGGAGWAIPKEAKNPEASWEWMRYQFGPEGWKIWLAKRDPQVFWLPALKALAEQDAKRLEQFYPNAAVVVKSADHIWFRPGSARWEQANKEAIGPAVSALHENKSPVRSTIQEAVQRANAILSSK